MMPQKVKPTFVFDMPRMVCVADIEAGKENLINVMNAIQPARAAIAQAESEMLLIAACDLIESAKGLETVSVSVEKKFNDGGGLYVELCVGCEYTPSGDDDDENIEDELHDVLSEIGEEISHSDLADNSLSPKDFMNKLAVLLLNEEPSRSWFAARESRAIAQVVPKSGKISGSISL